VVGCWDGVVILVQCDSLALIVSRVGISRCGVVGCGMIEMGCTTRQRDMIEKEIKKEEDKPKRRL